MFATIFGGVVSLLAAMAFLGVLLAKLPSIPLWIVVLSGIVLMAISWVEAVRQGE